MYCLTCRRFYGQIEGIFLTLREIEEYLRKHPAQPSPPKNMFEDEEYWEWYKPREERYENYYFSVYPVKCLDEMKKSETYIDTQLDLYILTDGHGVPLYVSKKEIRLKEIALREIFRNYSGFWTYVEDAVNAYIKTDADWFSSKMRRHITEINTDEIVSKMSSEDVENIWEDRIECDSFSIKYRIFCLGE